MVQRGIRLAFALSLFGLTGCAWLAPLGSQNQGAVFGKTYFVGGAGPLGEVVGTFSVPKGLREGHYRGAIEVYGWQAAVGGTLRDQIDRTRNEEQAAELARRIVAYERAYPGRRVNIIALSAGTGIAAWALEALPPDCRVGTVIFLSSSLSSRYDLTAALEHIDGRLYNYCSSKDPILRYGVPLAGTVDRSSDEMAAGLHGIALPRDLDVHGRNLYRLRVRNRAWRPSYKRYGYQGLHTDSTSERFVEHVLTPLLGEPLNPPRRVPGATDDAHATTQPAPPTSFVPPDASKTQPDGAAAN